AYIADEQRVDGAEEEQRDDHPGLEPEVTSDRGGTGHELDIRTAQPRIPTVRRTSPGLIGSPRRIPSSAQGSGGPRDHQGRIRTIDVRSRTASARGLTP